MKELVKVHVVAGLVIKKDGKYLMVQENRPSDVNIHGKWAFPAGRVDVGENINQTAVREAKEETGYDVKLIREIDIVHEDAVSDIKHAYEAQIIGGEINFPKDEILDVKWLAPEEIRKIKEEGNLRGRWSWWAFNLMENNVV